MRVILCAILCLFVVAPSVCFGQGRVVPADKSHSGFSYYGTTPESPSGSLICYVKFTERPVGRNGTKPGELWVCRRDLTGQEKIVDLKKCGNHNTARMQWVDDSRLAYQDSGKVYVVDVDSKKVVLGPIDGLIGHNVYDRKILVQVDSDGSSLGGKGLYEVDCDTGKGRFILKPSDLEKYVSDMVGAVGVEKWKFAHAQWSTKGSKIAIRLTVGDGGEMHALLFTFAADGSDIVYFGPKPMHFLWFDDDTIMGHDNQVDDGKLNDVSMRRWDRSGKYIETLAGPGNHTSASPDRQWFASESWYRTSPIKLSLYRRGDVKPVAILMEHDFEPITWVDRCHVNASFSRDGNRVYFFKAVEPNLAQAYFYDISSFKKK